ncbi:RecQ family ATP-dependent DNA helicase [Vibrio cholerae]|uniref:RecQ family ATP-dependent DNA helicase n=1 Tax=Vibrio cholerae TaxID=666 RepID=UPI000E68881C|nr:RecQ family ATP-dependent DNA helicase [Vibrio cholerae]
MIQHALYLTALRRYFGYDTFRTSQWTALSHLIEGSDVFCITPTGSGKSMLYQLPALVEDNRNLTILISPLLATIQDQLNEINSVSPGMACHLNSTTSKADRGKMINDILANSFSYKILICTPESFVNVLTPILSRSKLTISKIVIDEAHLILQWGINFRSAFVEIATAIERLSSNELPIQLLVLTATADNQSLDFISKNFKRKFEVVVESPIRENISYVVQEVSQPLVTPSVSRQRIEALISAQKKRHMTKHDTLSVMVASVIKMINGVSKSIIFCATRKGVEELASRIVDDSLVVYKYHGGMSSVERESVAIHYKSEIRPCVLVATNSFGVGVNIPDIRLSIHVDLPSNIDAYLQESGRIGRDGLPARSVLLTRNGQEADAAFYLLNRSFPSPNDVATLFEKLINMWNESHGVGFNIRISREKQSCIEFLISGAFIDAQLIYSDKDFAYSISDIIKSFDYETYLQHRTYIFGEFDKVKKYTNLDREELKPFLAKNYSLTIDSKWCSEGKIDRREISEILDNTLNKFAFEVIKCHPLTLMSKRNRSDLLDRICLNKQITPKDLVCNIDIDHQKKVMLTKAVDSAMRCFL